MSKTVLTRDDIEWAVTLVASLDPNDYPEPEIKSLIWKLRGTRERGSSWVIRPRQW